MGSTPWPYTLTSWSYRVPIAVQGTASAGPYFTITMPQWDAIWGVMQADGDDIRVTQYDGLWAAPSWENDAPDTSAREIGNFNVGDYTSAGANKVEIFWLYVGNSGAANAESAPTKTTSRACIVGGRPDPLRTVVCVPDPPGATIPAQRVSKKQDEEMDLWWDITPALGEAEPIAGRSASLYALYYVDVNTTDGSGIYSAESTQVASSLTVADTQFAEVDGRTYVGLRLASGWGTSGTDYICKLRMALTNDVMSRNAAGGPSEVTAEYRCLVQLRDTFT